MKNLNSKFINVNSHSIILINKKDLTKYSIQDECRACFIFSCFFFNVEAIFSAPLKRILVPKRKIFETFLSVKDFLKSLLYILLTFTLKICFRKKKL